MCPHEENLTAWLLGDLSPEAQEAMTRHVDGCPSCRAAAEALSRVLTPLRSGLAKDRNLRLATRRAGATPRQNPWAWLWHRPHAGLRRAAILAVSFGTLFGLFSVLYHGSRRESSPAEAVTHIEFRKRPDGAPPPALQPVPATAPEAGAPGQAVQHRNDVFPAEPPPVPYPAPPSAKPPPPALRRLPAGAAARTATETDADSAPAAAPWPSAAPAKAAAKRKSDKADAIEPPPPGLRIKPATLAGASLATTNTVPTNTAPASTSTPVRGQP